MILYLFNLIWVVIMASLAVRYSKVRYNSFFEMEIKQPNTFFIGFILLSLMSVYALRWQTGTDFGHYYHYYFAYGKLELSEIIGIQDWGFYGLTSLIYKIWPDNFVFYNYLLAVLTYIPVVLTYKNHSRYFTFTLILYITSVAYYWPFNGVRQSIAGSICFFAFPLLYKKKYFKYIILILIAYLFHSTALLMIPLLLLISRRAWSKSILFTLIILIGSVIFLPSIWSYIIKFLEIIGLGELASDYSVFNEADDGVNLLRILVAAVPVLISLLFYKRLKYINPNIDLLINMSLMYFVFMLLASQLTILARLSQYFIFYNALLIPEFISLFKSKDKVAFYLITVLLFFIHMCVILPVDSDLLPYELIFNK